MSNIDNVPAQREAVEQPEETYTVYIVMTGRDSRTARAGLRTLGVPFIEEPWQRGYIAFRVPESADVSRVFTL